MIGENLRQFWQYTGFANFEWTYLLMICIGLVFIYLAIKKEWEPMLLVPIGFGIIIGNIPLFPGLYHHRQHPPLPRPLGRHL